jgi:hypothetical protein
MGSRERRGQAPRHEREDEDPTVVEDELDAENAADPDASHENGRCKGCT